MQQPTTNDLAAQEIARQLGQTIIANIHLQIALQQLAGENAALKAAAQETKPTPFDASGVSASDLRDLER